jgi:predicted metal-dependent peptidase
MTVSKALQKLLSAKVQVALNHPFFAFLTSQIRLVETKTRTDTLGTDGSRIFYHGEYTSKRSVQELIFILCHEILHIINLHPSRRGSRDPKIWNFACDYCVNLILVDAGLRPPPNILLDEKYRGMTAEQVYDKLYERSKEGGGSNKLETLDDHGGWGGGDCQQGDREARERDGAGGGEDELGPPLTPEQIREMAVQAFHSAKMCGDVPAGIERMFDALMRPKVNWEQVLYRFVERLERDDYSYERYSRRYEPFGIYLPALVDQDGLQLGIGVDTSGSIGDADLTRFISEIVAVMRQRVQVKARFLICDAAIHSEFVLDNSMGAQEVIAKLRSSMAGGGGTDMNPILREIDEKRPEIGALIILTDGYIPPPIKPKRRLNVLWALTHDTELPFGQKILIGSDG